MRHRRVVVAGLAALLSLVGCSGPQPDQLPDPAPQDVPPRLRPYYEQRIAWAGCGGDFECATLRVPRDYDEPLAGELALSLLRSPAKGGDRLGSLVVNPGGPGASGVEYARAARAIVGPDVLRRYDIVGFDPRGVGESAPVDCLTDPEVDDLLNSPAAPIDPSEIALATTTAARAGAGCSSRSGEVAPWVDTVSTARDLDVLRAALGDQRLHYLGKSFGTAIGTVYAEQFPQRVGRMVLDGPFPVSLASDEIALGQALGFESALRRFASDCLQRRDCPLRGRSVEAAVAEIGDFLVGLRSRPLPTGDPRALTESLGSLSVLYSLYFPPGDWDRLRQGLAAGLTGDGSALLAMLDQRLERGSDGRFRGNTLEAFYAVSCLDRPASEAASLPALAERFAQRAPTFGRYLAWSEAVCAQWPYQPVSLPRRVAAPGAPPILVVATQHDPATPYPWGQLLVDQLESGVLISYGGDGHTAYRRGSPCVDQVVDRYLVAGSVPEDDPRCGY